MSNTVQQTSTRSFSQSLYCCAQYSVIDSFHNCHACSLHILVSRSYNVLIDCDKQQKQCAIASTVMSKGQALIFSCSLCIAFTIVITRFFISRFIFINTIGRCLKRGNIMDDVDANVSVIKKQDSQSFSLPESVIAAVAQKARESSKLSYKLYSTCKQLYPKDGVLIIGELTSSQSSDITMKYLNGKIVMPLEMFMDSSIALTITEKLSVMRRDQPLLVSTILQKIQFCQITILVIHFQTLTLAEYQLLTKKVKNVTHMATKIVDSDENLIPLVNLMECSSKASYFNFAPAGEHTDRYYTSETFKDLTKFKLNLPSNATLKYIFEAVPHTFNAETFGSFVKNNAGKKFTFHVYFKRRDANLTSTVIENHKAIVQTAVADIPVELRPTVKIYP